MAAPLPTQGEAGATTTLSQAQYLTGTGPYSEIGPAIALAPLEEALRSEYQKIDVGLIEEKLFGTTQKADDQGRVFMGYEYESPDPAALQGFSLKQLGGKWHLYDPEGRSVAWSGQGDGINRILSAVKAGTTAGGKLPDASVIAALESISKSPVEMRKPVYQTGYQPGEEVQISKGMVDVMGPSKAKTIDPETGEITYGRPGYDARGNRLGESDIAAQEQATREEQQAIADVDLAQKYTGEYTDLMRSQGRIDPLLGQVASGIKDTGTATTAYQQGIREQVPDLLMRELTPRQVQKITERMRAGEAARGSIRDFGAGVREVQAIMEEDDARYLQNLQAAANLMGLDMNLGGELQRQTLAGLEAEKSTAASPTMFSTAPSVGKTGTISTGTQTNQLPNVFDPTAGMDYEYNRAMDIDAAKRADRAQNIGIGTSIFSAGTDVLSS